MLNDDFVAAMPGPEIIQPTSQAIFALTGVNTLSSNCDDTTVTFLVGLKQYVDKKIAEAIQIIN